MNATPRRALTLTSLLLLALTGCSAPATQPSTAPASTTTASAKPTHTPVPEYQAARVKMLKAANIANYTYPQERGLAYEKEFLKTLDVFDARCAPHLTPDESKEAMAAIPSESEMLKTETFAATYDLVERSLYKMDTYCGTIDKRNYGG